MVRRRRIFFENLYFPISEEDFSFFEIPTPLENVAPRKPKGPLESCKFLNPPLFFRTKIANPITWGGGGSKL